MKIEIHSLQETQEFATKMADLCRNKQLVITLDGDLGAGKTTWTKSFGKALGVKNVINSPTFTILKDYKQEGGVPFHHIDAYRLEGKCQDLGFEDCFDEGITVVEWSEFIEDHPESGVNTFEDLIEKAKSGEEEPLNAFKLFGKRLGAAVSNCINVLNPEIVVLAGIDSEYSYLYKKELLSIIRKYSGSASRKIILSKNNDDFTVIGAILTAIQKYCE